MKFFRLSTLMAVTCAAISGSLLFSTAQKVQQTENEMRRIQGKVTQEEQTIRVLRAEWDYLNRPDRLESLVKNNLDLQQARPESVRNDTSEIPEPYMPIIPARKPAYNPSYTSPVMKPVPAVLQAESHDAPASGATLTRPSAPQSPDHDTPQKDFNKLLHELAPAGGGE